MLMLFQPSEDGSFFMHHFNRTDLYLRLIWYLGQRRDCVRRNQIGFIRSNQSLIAFGITNEIEAFSLAVFCFILFSFLFGVDSFGIGWVSLWFFFDGNIYYSLNFLTADCIQVFQRGIDSEPRFTTEYLYQ